jgi:hypothetical protein
VRARRRYPGQPAIIFHATDYGDGMDEDDGSFDLLISLYGGFVSQACRRYPRTDGVLVANNSHGDASMALLDPGYENLGVILHRNGRWCVIEDGLEDYLTPQKPQNMTRERIERDRRGTAFVKPAAAYLFRKTN